MNTLKQLFLGICLIIGLGLNIGFSNYTNAYSTWLRNTDLIVEDPDQVIDNLTQNTIDTVYLQIDRSVSSKIYQQFLKKAHSNDITVYALDGSPKWALSPKSAQSLINRTATYNKKNPKDTFAGIHLDVEPYLLDEWDTNQKATILSYQNFVKTSVNLASKKGLTIDMDIPFWFDEISYSNTFGKGDLAKRMIKNTNSTTIMAYRDTASAIASVIKNEILYAKKYNKFITLGIETNSSQEGDAISFYEEGKDTLIDELNTLRSLYPNIQIAVHDYSGFTSLR